MRPWSIERAGQTLVENAAEQRVSLPKLSRMIGRPGGYLGRFVREGVPQELRTEERRRLARFFGINEDLLTAFGAMPKRVQARPARTGRGQMHL